MSSYVFRSMLGQINIPQGHNYSPGVRKSPNLARRRLAIFTDLASESSTSGG